MIPAFERWRQEGKFKVILGYIASLRPDPKIRRRGALVRWPSWGRCSPPNLTT